MANLTQKMSNTKLIGLDTKKIIAKSIFKTMIKEPNRTFEMKALAVYLEVEQLLPIQFTPHQLN